MPLNVTAQCIDVDALPRDSKGELRVPWPSRYSFPNSVTVRRLVEDLPGGSGAVRCPSSSELDELVLGPEESCRMLSILLVEVCLMGNGSIASFRDKGRLNPSSPRCPET